MIVERNKLKEKELLKHASYLIYPRSALVRITAEETAPVAERMQIARDPIWPMSHSLLRISCKREKSLETKEQSKAAAYQY